MIGDDEIRALNEAMALIRALESIDTVNKAIDNNQIEIVDGKLQLTSAGNDVLKAVRRW